MVLDSYSKYDGILAGIGLTIALALIGTVFSPMLVFTSGILGLTLMAFGMFVVGPVDAPIPEVNRKI